MADLVFAGLKGLYQAYEKVKEMNRLMAEAMLEIRHCQSCLKALQQMSDLLQEHMDDEEVAVDALNQTEDVIREVKDFVQCKLADLHEVHVRIKGFTQRPMEVMESTKRIKNHVESMADLMEKMYYLLPRETQARGDIDALDYLDDIIDDFPFDDKKGKGLSAMFRTKHKAGGSVPNGQCPEEICTPEYVAKGASYLDVRKNGSVTRRDVMIILDTEEPEGPPTFIMKKMMQLGRARLARGLEARGEEVPPELTAGIEDVTDLTQVTMEEAAAFVAEHVFPDVKSNPGQWNHGFAVACAAQCAKDHLSPIWVGRGAKDLTSWEMDFRDAVTGMCDTLTTESLRLGLLVWLSYNEEDEIHNIELKKSMNRGLSLARRVMSDCKAGRTTGDMFRKQVTEIDKEEKGIKKFVQKRFDDLSQFMQLVEIDIVVSQATMHRVRLTQAMSLLDTHLNCLILKGTIDFFGETSSIDAVHSKIEKILTENEKAAKANAEFDIRTIIKDEATAQFWAMYFGKTTYSVGWERFKSAVERDTDGAVSRLAIGDLKKRVFDAKAKRVTAEKVDAFSRKQSLQAFLGKYERSGMPLLKQMPSTRTAMKKFKESPRGAGPPGAGGRSRFGAGARPKTSGTPGYMPRLGKSASFAGNGYGRPTTGYGARKSDRILGRARMAAAPHIGRAQSLPDPTTPDPYGTR